LSQLPGPCFHVLGCGFGVFGIAHFGWDQSGRFFGSSGCRFRCECQAVGSIMNVRLSVPLYDNTVERFVATHIVRLDMARGSASTPSPALRAPSPQGEREISSQFPLASSMALPFEPVPLARAPRRRRRAGWPRVRRIIQAGAEVSLARRLRLLPLSLACRRRSWR
jgi:hypothetical protein